MAFVAASRFRWLLLSVALCSAACRPKIPEGRFACKVDRDCPPAFLCHAQLCYEKGAFPADEHHADAGLDGSAQSGHRHDGAAALADAETAADARTVGADAQVDLGQAPLRIVNAAVDVTADALSVQIDDGKAFALNYAAVSAPFPGDARSVRVRVRDAQNRVVHEVRNTLTAPAALVLVSTAVGIASRFVVQPPPADGGAMTQVALVNAMRTGFTLRVDQRTSNPDEVSVGALEVQAALPFMGVPQSLSLTRSGTAFIAAYSGFALPPQAMVVLLGSPDRALLDPRGPRALLLDEANLRPLLSDPLVGLVNLFSPPERVHADADAGTAYVPALELCATDDLGRRDLVPMNFQDVLGPFPFFSHDADSFRILPDDATDCDSATGITEILGKGLALQKGHRYLVVLAGSAPNPAFAFFPEGARDAVTQADSRIVTFGHAAPIITGLGDVGFTVSPLDSSFPIYVSVMRSRWGEESSGVLSQPLKMDYPFCSPTCSPRNALYSLAGTTSQGSFLVAADPYLWSAPALRLLVINAPDGLPWTLNEVVAP